MRCVVCVHVVRVRACVRLCVFVRLIVCVCAFVHACRACGCVRGGVWVRVSDREFVLSAAVAGAQSTSAQSAATASNLKTRAGGDTCVEASERVLV